MPETQSLGALIDEQIRLTGPMPLSVYMQLCLTHPTLGYYRKADPLGLAGDFVTAPEISQLFGEMLGIWARLQWQALGSPAAFELVELGPGRGIMMADMLRAIATEPGMLASMRLTLLETNPVLIAEQRRRLTEFDPRWIGGIMELAQDGPPLLVMANEFFDVLPIRQYQKANGQWHERVIGLDASGRRVWGLSPSPLPPDIFPEAARDAGENAIWEAGLAAREVMSTLARRLSARGGVLLVIDYGYEKTQTGDTFQAIARHNHTDPLADPGQADLTAHVDFEALIEAARQSDAEAVFIGTQGEFLNGLGIAGRANALAARNPAQADVIASGLDRLVAPGQMGDLFKVMMAFARPGA